MFCPTVHPLNQMFSICNTALHPAVLQVILQGGSCNGSSLPAPLHNNNRVCMSVVCVFLHFLGFLGCCSNPLHVSVYVQRWRSDLNLTWNTQREQQSASLVPLPRRCQSSVNHSTPPTHKSCAKTTHQWPLGGERKVGAAPLDNDLL